MSERRSSADLGLNLEAALSAFPFPERDWEKSARAVSARLGESLRGSTDDALLAAPFPNQPGEPTTLSATTTPLTHSGVRPQSLAEIARRSVEQKQAAERAMMRESIALASRGRPSPEEPARSETVSAVRAVVAPPAPSTPRGAVAAPATVGTAPTAVVAAPAAAAAPGSAQPPWGKLGFAMGALALAAATLLWLRKPTPEPLVTNSGVAATAATETKAAAPAVAASNTPQPVAAAAPTAIDPSTLSAESAAAPSDAKRAKLAAATPSAAAAPSTSAVAAGPAPEKLVLEDDQPAAPAAAAAEKVASKPLPADPALRPADSTTGGAMPVKPSTGAVQAALGSVMSGARHCVAGDDAASSAVVVFASDGHVQSVTVHGPAAGKPSGACIEAQLSRARVQPFAAASFSINATVRPD